MNNRCKWADPDVHPLLRSAGSEEREITAYTDLIRWRDMYENVTPGKHVTEKDVQDVLRYVHKSPPSVLAQHKFLYSKNLSRPARQSYLQQQQLTARATEKHLESLGYLKKGKTKRLDVSVSPPPRPPSPPHPTRFPSISDRVHSGLSSPEETFEEYQWNLHPSKFKYLRKPLALTNIPEARRETPIPKEKMMDSLRTNSFTTFDDPRTFMDKNMFPMLMTKIPRRRKPEDGESDIDQEDCFFALPSPPASTFAFFKDVPGWDVNEQLSFQELPSFTSEELLDLRGNRLRPLRQTKSYDSIQFRSDSN